MVTANWRGCEGESAPSGPGAGTCFNRVTPGFWGQRPPTYCVADGQVMIEAGRVLVGLQKAASTAPAHALTTPFPMGAENHLINIAAGVQ